MKILFLDIDGVLNQYDGMAQKHMFDYVCVRILHKIYDSVPDLKIVLSSSWRGLTERKFIERGIGLVIHGDTPVSKGLSRMDEIEEWMRGKEVSSWVALDDELSPHHPNVVKTDMMIGLRWADADRAIEILNGAKNE